MGLVGGSLCAFLAARSLSSLLYGVSPTDWKTYVSLAAAFALASVSASYLAARRAAHTSPAEALRSLQNR